MRLADAVAHPRRHGVEPEEGPVPRDGARGPASGEGARGPGLSMSFRHPGGSLLQFISHETRLA
jgi:hypothetical protein